MDSLFNRINDIIASPIWTLLWYLFWFAIITLWLALVFWTLKDARRRIDDSLIVVVAVATSLVFPFIGTLVYLILRPSETLADRRERELEMRAMELELRNARVCPSCRESVRDDYLVCPKCRKPLRASCTACGRPIEYSWKVCPYCSQEVGVVARYGPQSLESAPEEVVQGSV